MYDNIKVQPALPLAGAVFAMGSVGAVVGATSAAAKNIFLVKKNEIGGVEAAKSVLKESAGVGLATAAATAVIGAVVPRTSFFSILGFALVATGTKMLWDRAAYPEKKALPILKSELKPELKPELKLELKPETDLKKEKKSPDKKK